MAEQEFQKLQWALAAHLRDPLVQAPPPGLEDRRLKIYRDLLYNTVEDALANAFPVLRRMSPDAVWHRRVREFYVRHRSPQPQLHQLAGEFLSHLQAQPSADDLPFLIELAHYEWVELELSVSTIRLDEVPVRTDGDLLEAAPLLSPLAWPLAYEWPVHQLSPDHQPAEPPAQPTCLVVYRNRADDVKFMQVNAVTARLLQAMEEAPEASGRALLENIAMQLGHPQPEAVIASGAQTLADLHARDIVLGTRP